MRQKKKEKGSSLRQEKKGELEKRAARAKKGMQVA
jgi:hypothetical protein